MKKLPIAILLGVIVSIFAGADFYLNNLGGNGRFDLLKASEPASTPLPSTPPLSISPVLSQFKIGDRIQDYEVKRQTQVSQIFEKVDLSTIKDIRIYRNELEKAASATAETPAPLPLTLKLYEIQAPAGQGSLTYLALKLQFIAQINPATETLNEDHSLGNNSFFFNNQNYADTTFLMVQIHDYLYGFQFEKKDSVTYDAVKAMVSQWMAEPAITH